MGQGAQCYFLLASSGLWLITSSDKDEFTEIFSLKSFYLRCGSGQLIALGLQKSVGDIQLALIKFMRRSCHWQEKSIIDF